MSACRRKAFREPARDVPAEIDRHVGVGDPGVREFRARACRPGSEELAGYAHCGAPEFAARGVAQRARLRIREEAQQAIVVGEKDRRHPLPSGDAAATAPASLPSRRAARSEARPPGGCRRCEDRGSGAPSGTPRARRLASLSGSPSSSVRRAAPPPMEAASPAETASSVPCAPWGWGNCRRSCSSPCSPPVVRGFSRQTNRYRVPLRRVSHPPSAPARSAVITAAAAVESTRLAATGPGARRTRAPSGRHSRRPAAMPAARPRASRAAEAGAGGRARIRRADATRA